MAVPKSTQTRLYVYVILMINTYMYINSLYLWSVYKHNELTIIVYDPDGSVLNVHLSISCSRPSLSHKVLDFQCQSSIFCCFQTQVIKYSLVVAYSPTCFCYSFISYFIDKIFLLLIVLIRWVTTCNENNAINSAVCFHPAILNDIRKGNGHATSFLHIQVGCSGELPKPTMFVSGILNSTGDQLYTLI